MLSIYLFIYHWFQIQNKIVQHYRTSDDSVIKIAHPKYCVSTNIILSQDRRDKNKLPTPLPIVWMYILLLTFYLKKTLSFLNRLICLNVLNIPYRQRIESYVF